LKRWIGLIEADDEVHLFFGSVVSHFTKWWEEELCDFLEELKQSKSKNIDVYVVFEEEELTIRGLFCIIEDGIITYVFDIWGLIKIWIKETQYLRFLLKEKIDQLKKEFPKDIVKNIICNNYSFTIDDFKVWFRIPQNLPDDVLF